MASPTHSLTARDEAGVLRDFYLLLWKQLDLRAGESNWFEIAAVTATDLQARARELLDQIVELQAEPELVSTARQDGERLLDTIQQRPAATDDTAAFKTYLRDRALDFAKQAARL
ncbi:MAG: hypothetical protein WD733_05220 [Bryobacterales bacterium]